MHDIELEEAAVPHREGARRMTPHKSEEWQAEIKMLLQYELIEPSKSPCFCGVVTAKKNGGQLRFCCDSHNLKVVTKKDAYPIPRIDENLSKLGGVKFFTTLGLGFASCSLMLIKTYERMGFTKEDLIRTSLILAAAIRRAI